MLEHLTKRFTINQREIEKEAIKRVAPKIAELNTAKQLEVGLTAKGQPVRPAYADSTKRYKRRKGQPVDRVTLRDTGRFHNTFKVIADDTDIMIQTNLELQRGFNLSDHLAGRYKDILGLTDESITELVTKVKPVFIELVKDALVTQ